MHFNHEAAPGANSVSLMLPVHLPAHTASVTFPTLAGASPFQLDWGSNRVTWMSTYFCFLGTNMVCWCSRSIPYSLQKPCTYVMFYESTQSIARPSYTPLDRSSLRTGPLSVFFNSVPPAHGSQEKLKQSAQWHDVHGPRHVFFGTEGGGSSI